MLSYTPDSPIQQSEQVNGFWLIQFTLQKPLPFELSIGRAFSLSEAPETQFYLFQHADNHPSQQYQFLSKKVLPPEILTRPGNLTSTNNKPTMMPAQNRALLILGEDLAMANGFALAKQRANLKLEKPTLAALASETAFPFMIKPARFLMPEMPPEAIGACTLLEDWKIQNRLASLQGLPGCFEGDLAELFDYWTRATQPEIDQHNKPSWQVIIFADESTQKKCLQISQNKTWLTVQTSF